MDSKPIKITQEEEGSDGDEATALTGKPILKDTQIIDVCNNDISKKSASDGFSKWKCKRLSIISIICVVVIIGIVAVIIHQTYGKHKIIRDAYFIWHSRILILH